ncbi:hypothetical protein GGQ03_003157 [Salinibacter ruber]|nr:hypothetical protein [Salinibacter ruber]
MAIADGEDHFLSKSDLLRLFAERVYGHWSVDWSLKKKNTSKDVLGAIGEGLLKFLRSQAITENGQTAEENTSTVVTKTPHPKNVGLFDRLFHDSFLILLIRDGRAVTESRMRTFEESFDEAVQAWRRGAREVIRFVEEHGWTSDWHRVLKYETVFKDPEEELRQIYDDVGMNFSSYPSSYLEEIAVVGSSTYGEDGEGVTWEEKQDDGSFNPLNRFQDWEKEKHERFEWLAGEEFRNLGYTTSQPITSASVARHYLLDVKQFPKNAKRAVHAKLRSLVFSHVTE